MKNTARLAAALLALTAASTFSTAASAAQPGFDLQPKMGYEISIGQYVETYDELDDNGGRIMTEEAQMTSIKLTQNTRLDHVWAHRMELDFAFGDTKYTGSYWGGKYGDLVEDGISRWRLDTEYSLLMTPPSLNGLTFSGGIGYRVLNDSLHEVEGGYQRINKTWYASLGAEYRMNLANGWVVTPAVKYRHMLKGTQTTSIAADMNQPKGYGHDLSIKFEKVNSYGYGFSASVFMRNWDVEKSEHQPYLLGSGTVYEPKNKTREVGIQLGYLF